MHRDCNGSIVPLCLHGYKTGNHLQLQPICLDEESLVSLSVGEYPTKLLREYSRIGESTDIYPENPHMSELAPAAVH